MSRVRYTWNPYPFLMILCLMFTLGGIGAFKQGYKMNKESEKIEATVNEKTRIVDDEGSSVIVYVDYEYEGVTYTHVNAGSILKKCEKGDTITVRISKDDHSDIVSGAIALIWVGIIFIGGSLIALFFVTRIFIRGLKHLQDRKNLIKTGIKVIAKVSEIERNVYRDNEGGSDTITYTAICKYKDKTYISREYERKNAVYVGDRVPLYISPDNEDMYYLDLKNIE